MKIKQVFAFFILSALIGASLVNTSQAKEMRCGWVENDMPSQMTLKDKDGVWTLADASGVVRGFTKMPSFPKGDTCACITMDANVDQLVVGIIYQGKIIPIKRCQQDKSINW